MTLFSPGDRSEKIGMRLDSLLVSESWGEIWRATHDKLSRILVVAYKREEGKNLFLACREGLETWKRLADSGTPGILRIHKIVSSGKIPMLLVEDPGGDTAREFFSSEAATLKKTARMVRACCRTLQALKSEGLLPVGITPDTIIRKEGAEDYPSYLIPVSPGVFGDAVRLGDGRYISPDALLLGDRESVNADVYSLAWLWAEVLARNHKLDHQTRALRQAVHYPKLREIITGALIFKHDQYLDPKKLEFQADQWLEDDAANDRDAFNRWAEERKAERRKRRRERRRREARLKSEMSDLSAAAVADEDADLSGGSASEDGVSEADLEADDSMEEEDGAEDHLAFAEDIPGLAEPARRPVPAASGGAGAAVAEPAPSRGGAKPGSTGSPIFPALLSGCFVFVIVSAFSVGAWILMRDDDSSASRETRQVVDATETPQSGDDVPAGAEEPGASTPSQGSSVDGADTGVAPTEGAPASPAVDPSTDPGATAALQPESVQALLEAFREANRLRDLGAIRDLYFEPAEFQAVEGILSNLGGAERELAQLDFIPREETAPASDEEFQGVGKLRVATSGFSIEIPVGRKVTYYYLTSNARAGEPLPSAPTPVPTEAPLEFARWVKGDLPANVDAGRMIRVGLGEVAQAAILLERTPGESSPLRLSATLSNPGGEAMYYQYVLELADEEGQLVTAGGGGGTLEPGLGDQVEMGMIVVPESALSRAVRYEARWYESTIPLGLVGARIVKNPRLPIGFGRAHAFDLGDPEDGIVGRIYTEYLDNQKVLVAPVIVQNERAEPLDVICTVAFYDEKNQMLSGRSQQHTVESGSIKPFEGLVYYLPQAVYGEVVSYQAVAYVNGEEAGRMSEALPVGDGEEDPLSLVAPTPTTTPRPTPTPLPSTSAEATEPYRNPEEEMSVEEAVAMLDPPEMSGDGVGSAASGIAGDPGVETGYGSGVEHGSGGATDAQVETAGKILSGLGAAWGVAVVCFGYFLAAFCFQKIMEKAGKRELALVAWVPVVNWVLVPWLISGRSIIFPIFALIFPCLGLFFYVAMWYDVCLARNKNGVWAFVTAFVPIVGVPYLAFSE